MKEMRQGNRGQSLVEVLIATVVGTIMVISAVTLIAPALKSNTDVARTQTAIALGKELLEGVRVWAEADWHNVTNLATTSANRYYLNTSSSPFMAATSTETISVSTTTYIRYFYVDDVNRDGAGKITTGAGTPDPSTKKVTVVSGYVSGATSTLAAYLTRFRNNVLDETEWSGGSGQEGPVNSPNGRFATSANVNYTTTTGSILINL